jgi:hypothetical protein
MGMKVRGTPPHITDSVRESEAEESPDTKEKPGFFKKSPASFF